MVPEINNILNNFKTIRLQEMDYVRFMDRFETKYLLSVNRVPELLKKMNGNYKVLDTNGHRITAYNTTYLDTPDYFFFNQHITGRNGRVKVRYRHYLSTGITYLEIKKKNQKERTIKWRIKNILEDNHFNDSAIGFIKKHIPVNSEMLKPVLVNSFKRITLVSDFPPERITIDMDLFFTNQDGICKELPLIAVAELKSDGIAARSPFSKLAKGFCLYPTGFSKYCIGNAFLNDLPRKNILKPKLLLINRIENEYNKSHSA